MKINEKTKIVEICEKIENLRAETLESNDEILHKIMVVLSGKNV